MERVIIASLLGVLATAAIAQSKAPMGMTSNPVVSSVRQMEERQSKNLTGAAEEMPADKYSYRPTPPQITFSHLVIHVTESNNSLCPLIAGEPERDVKLNESDSKDVLTKAMKDSFAYCEQVLSKADDSTLGQPVEHGGHTGTRAAALIHLVAAWSDHYSAAAMYLRLNNLLPPSAKKESH